METELYENQNEMERCQTRIHEREKTTGRRNTRAENMQIENAMRIGLPQI